MMLVRGAEPMEKRPLCGLSFSTSRDRTVFSSVSTHAPAARRSRTEGAKRLSERGSGKEYGLTLSTDAPRPPMTKQQKTELNMAKYIQSQSLFSCPAIPGSA
ncbi:hypothetical protein DD866_14110 [Staphylococcus pseudintermedius]|nr:hypothetical protein DD866_14110 [Staphylococcus pseudintermedius]